MAAGSDDPLDDLLQCGSASDADAEAASVAGTLSSLATGTVGKAPGSTKRSVEGADGTEAVDLDFVEEELKCVGCGKSSTDDCP
eukprot:6204303-Pyramimonas_sp.AAC.1